MDKLKRPPFSTWARARLRLQRGFGLLETGLLAVLMGGALLAGMAALKVREDSQVRIQNGALLAEADRHMLAFASVYNRLPCPDLNRDGFEDLNASGTACPTGAQKGWLPFKTLGLEDVDARRASRQLLYVVHRSVADLAAAPDDSWRPLNYQSDAVGYSRTPGRVFAPANIGTPDFCEKVQRIAAAPLTVAHARVGASTERPLAYAVVHPGRGLGDSGFDLAHANMNSVVVEAPEKSPIPGLYDDQVRVRTLGQLASALDCDRLLPSIDQVSLAGEIVAEVQSQKVTNTVVASILTGIHVVKGVIGLVKSIKAAVQVGTSAGYMTAATTELAAATAGCAVIIGCAALPHAIASMAAAAVSVAASTAALVATTYSMTATIVAGVLTTTAAIMAGVSIPAGFDFTAARNEALSALNRARTNTANAQTAYNNAVSAEASLLATKNTKLGELYYAGATAVGAANALAVQPDVLSSIYRLDNDVTITTTAADSWMNAARNQAMAEEAYANAQKLTSGGATDNSATLATIQAQIDAETDPDKKQKMIAAKAAIESGIASSSNNAAQVAAIDAQMVQQQTQIDAFNTQLLTESNTDTRARLITQRDELVRQKNTLYAQKLSITTDVTAARANRDAAVAASATARTGFDTAIGYLVYNATYIPYQVKTCTTSGSGSSAVTTCTMSNRTYNGSLVVMAAIDGLYERAGGLPWDGVYFQWWLSGQKRAEAASNLAKAQTAEQQAQSAYNTVVALSNGNGTAAPPQTVWDGWWPVLQRADARGGIR